MSDQRSDQSGTRFSLHSCRTWLSEIFWHFMTENTNTLFVLIDKQGAIMFANSSFARAIASPLDAVVGTNFLDYILGMQRSQALSLLRGSAQEQGPPCHLLSLAGPKTMPHSFYCQFFAQADCIAIVGESEIENLKRMQEQFIAINNELTNLSREYNRERAHAQRLLSELQQSQTQREALIAELEVKNAELERFTYTVSHDLKSPLITIQGFMGLFEKDLAAGNAERMQQDIQHISTATETMRRLLDELLGLSRIGRVVNPSQEVPLRELIDKAVDLVAGQIAERGVHVNIVSQLPVICGDRRRLVEVFQNLIDNAVKFMGEQPAPHIAVGGRQEDEGVTCYVQDNGMGIEPRYHDKIFGLFERLDPEGEGTGIGLALVKRIVEAHGGRIWVESKGYGQGCTFFFCLPTPGEKTS